MMMFETSKHVPDLTNAFLQIDFVFFMQHDKTDEFSVLDAADTKAGLLKTTRLLG